MELKAKYKKAAPTLKKVSMKSLVERKTFKPESKWKKLTNGK